MLSIRTFVAAAALAAGAFSPISASALMLDLDRFAAGSTSLDLLNVGDATVGDVIVDNFLDGFNGPPGAPDIRFFDEPRITPQRFFCMQGQTFCGATGAIDFADPFEDLVFWAVQEPLPGSGAFANLRAELFNGPTLVSTLFWNDLGGILQDPDLRRFDFTGAGPADRLVLNSSGNSAGYGAFSFSRPGTGPGPGGGADVPLPAAGVLLLGGLGGLGAVRRFRRS